MTSLSEPAIADVRRPSGGVWAAAAVTGVLVADALLHVYWATGARWPAASTRSLSIALLGFTVNFTPVLLVSLAATLTVAAAGVWLRYRHGRVGVVGVLAHIVTGGVAAGLLLRALLGVLWLLPLGYLPGTFRWLNALMYTPLCGGLAFAAFRLLGAGRVPGRGWRRLVSVRTAALAGPAVATAALLTVAYGFTPTAQTSYRPQQYLGTVPSQFVNTPVARFHYIAAGSGSPVVLISPGSSWVGAWLPEFKALSADHAVYAVDMPGQGFTILHDHHFAFDLAAMTGALDQFLDALRLPTVALAGNSWSGGWALAYAQRYPDRVSRLLLLAPSGLAEPDPLSWELFKLPVVGKALANFSVSSRSQVAAGLRGLFVHKWRVTPAMIEAMWAPNTLPDNVRATYELEARLDWSVTQAKLPQTRQPALIIWGRRDNTLPVRHARIFARLMPSADIHILDGCGHALTLDCPDQVTTLMTGFLRGT